MKCWAWECLRTSVAISAMRLRPAELARAPDFAAAKAGVHVFAMLAAVAVLTMLEMKRRRVNGSPARTEAAFLSGVIGSELDALQCSKIRSSLFPFGF